MNALSILSAYMDLSAEDQAEVHKLMSKFHKERLALCTLQKEFQDLTGEVSAEVVPAKVIPLLPRKGNQGRKPQVNGPSDIVRKLLAQNPSISYAEVKAHAREVNPSINLNSLYMVFHKETKFRKVA